MELVLIAAVAANGVIGRDGTLPWHYPEDLEHFKETTMGHPVIMGRVAFEDILEHLGEPLPGRTNIVMSRSDPKVPEGVIVATDWNEAVEAAEGTGSDVAYVAGGRTIYEVAFPHADRMVLSELEATYEGDVEFPAWDPSVWDEVERRSFADFDVVEYVRTD